MKYYISPTYNFPIFYIKQRKMLGTIGVIDANNFTSYLNRRVCIKEGRWVEGLWVDYIVGKITNQC